MDFIESNLFIVCVNPLATAEEDNYIQSSQFSATTNIKAFLPFFIPDTLKLIIIK
jgi:hypothetical protein